MPRPVHLIDNNVSAGVSNCYVFKSRLQEYAQKVGVSTPVYDTTKEGPSHEPYFKSSVIVNDVRYDSLQGFSNRKAAEQSAAEVALLELAKSADDDQCISPPVQETGLCKNLLQEYAQKMNYAIPLYQCQKDEAPGRATLFQCTIEIGGIRYIRASAKTKKEAEIKAARTALLAIQSDSSESVRKSIETTQLTVLPSKKRPAEPVVSNLVESRTLHKCKRGRHKKKQSNKKFPGNRGAQACVLNPAKLDQIMNCGKETLLAQTMDLMPQSQDGTNQCEQVRVVTEDSSDNHVSGLAVSAQPDQSSNGNIPPVPCGDTASPAKDSNGADMKLTSSSAMSGLENGSRVAVNLICESE